MAGYQIEIVPYDPAWPSSFETERDRLLSVLSEHVVRVEHMGSTAVPGLDSKPIIDLSAAVRDLGVVPSLLSALEAAGYRQIELDTDDRFDLWRQVGCGPPTHILHFMEDGSGAWVRPLIFRNALRADVALREEYAELKRRLALECVDDIRRYGKGKTEFIHRVVNAYLCQP